MGAHINAEFITSNSMKVGVLPAQPLARVAVLCGQKGEIQGQSE